MIISGYASCVYPYCSYMPKYGEGREKKGEGNELFVFGMEEGK